MESMTSTSSVSGPQEASHKDEIFMQQSILFSESLNVCVSFFYSFCY